MILLSEVNRQFQSLKPELVKQFEQLIDSGKYIMGNRVMVLEEALAKKTGALYAIGVANGTDALVLTLDAYGIGAGDEVITTPYTFFATAEAISRRGATPVFADVEPDTYNINPSHVEALITTKTKAILPVHLFGQPVEMDSLNQIAKKHGLVVIEDACQAFGATYKGKPVGSLGDAACFSFFPTKNLGTMGDGGMIVTSDPLLASQIRKLRHHGSRTKYYHDEIGYNSRLDELHAMILLTALERMDDWNAQRRALAQRYYAGLQQLSYLQLPVHSQDNNPVYHLFCLASNERDQVVASLRQADIQTGIYYPCPLHLQKAYEHLHYKKGDFPVAEQLASQLFAIPMNPFLKPSEQDQVIAALQSFPQL